MSKPNYTSLAGVFEKRGDPWLTEREKAKDYNRNPETEDAEYDFDHRFHRNGASFGKPDLAKVRVEHRDPIPVKRDDDPARRKASIARRMNAALARHGAVREVEPALRPFRSCNGCRSAACISKGICQK